MKLVREILYEKFTEESDAVKDMGIGSKFVYYRFYKGGVGFFCLIDGDTFGIKDILKNFNFKWSEIDYAWKSNYTLSEEFWIKAIPQVFQLIEKRGGYIVQLHGKITNWERDMNRTFSIPGWDEWEYPQIPDGDGAKVYFKQWHHHAPMIGAVGKGSYSARAILRYEGYNFNHDSHMWEKVYDKESTDDLIEYLKSKNYTVIDGRKNEINEKFTEESDPIRDLDIGGFSYRTLKPGAIIKPKKSMRFGKGTGTLVSRGGNFVTRYTYILITHASQIYQSKDMYLVGFEFYNVDLDYMMKRREQFKRGELTPQITRYWENKIKIIIKEQSFNNRFEIIERGF